MSVSGSNLVWDGSRAARTGRSARLTSGSTSPSWSTTRIRPPGRVTRASSETTSSGRRAWWSTRRHPARSNSPRRTAAPRRRPRERRRSPARAPARRRRAPRESRCRPPRGRAAPARRRTRRPRSPSRAHARRRGTAPRTRVDPRRELGARCCLQREPQIDVHRSSDHLAHGPRRARVRHRRRSHSAIVPATAACSSARTPSPRIVTGSPTGSSRVELDREGVHRHRADDTGALARDQHLGPGQVTAEAVGVPDRDDADPGRPLGDERAPVAGALPVPEQLHLREGGLPPQRRRQPVRAGIVTERRDAVQRDRRTARRRAATRGRPASPALLAMCRVQVRDTQRSPRGSARAAAG